MTAELEDPDRLADADAERLPLRHFLVRRRMARMLWGVSAVFWGGAALALVSVRVAPFYDNAAAGLLYLVLFPPLVCLYLLMGWLRQEIDSGRIVLEPGPLPSSRSVSGFSDPMADAYDARSPLYSRRVRELHRRRY